MMSEKEFIKSQEECASMIGMNLKEYQEYCSKLKVPINNINNEYEKEDRTLELMNYLGIDKSKLKKRKEK